MKRLEHMTEPELREFLNTLAGGIELMASELGVEKPHFCLVVFNDPKVAQYVSNCRRGDIIQAMRETANRLASKEDVTR